MIRKRLLSRNHLSKRKENGRHTALEDEKGQVFRPSGFIGVSDEETPIERSGQVIIDILHKKQKKNTAERLVSFGLET